MLLLVAKYLHNMAKLHTITTAHGNARAATKSDNVRILVDVYHKNKKVGTLGVYHVQPTDTINVVWDAGRGALRETILIDNGHPATD